MLKSLPLPPNDLPSASSLPPFASNQIRQRPNSPGLRRVADRPNSGKIGSGWRVRLRSATLIGIERQGSIAASGETHAWGAQTMHLMQAACNKASYELWKTYSKAMRANPPIHLRDLLDV